MTTARQTTTRATTRARRVRVPRTPSELEALFLLHLACAGMPVPEREYVFARALGRKWRADFCWPQATPPVLVEIDGGTWASGRHSRGAGYANDCEKLNAAALLGYIVLRFTGEMVRSGAALETVTRALAMRRVEGVA